jgi:hypothetical protein
LPGSKLIRAKRLRQPAGATPVALEDVSERATSASSIFLVADLRDHRLDE